VYQNFLRTAKLQPERALAEVGVTQALVLVPESWGSRVITGLWAMGAPASLVERVYRRVDACDLYLYVQAARGRSAGVDEVTRDLQQMLRSTEAAVPTLPGSPDPTLRLRPRDDLPEACRVELRRDYTGFTTYGNLGWRNAPGMDTGIVFARDFYEHNAALLEHYIGWEVWRYAPPPDNPSTPPQLRKLREASSVVSSQDSQ
jgi:hypothetical protein